LERELDLWEYSEGEMLSALPVGGEMNAESGPGVSLTLEARGESEEGEAGINRDGRCLLR
jgi:hypothetical protein